MPTVSLFRLSCLTSDELRRQEEELSLAGFKEDLVRQPSGPLNANLGFRF